MGFSIGDITKPLEKELKQVGRAAADVVKTVGEPVMHGTKQVVEPVMEDVFRPVAETTVEAAPYLAAAYFLGPAAGGASAGTGASAGYVSGSAPAWVEGGLLQATGSGYISAETAYATANTVALFGEAQAARNVVAAAASGDPADTLIALGNSGLASDIPGAEEITTAVGYAKDYKALTEGTVEERLKVIQDYGSAVGVPSGALSTDVNLLNIDLGLPDVSWDTSGWEEYVPDLGIDTDMQLGAGIDFGIPDDWSLDVSSPKAEPKSSTATGGISRDSMYNLFDIPTVGDLIEEEQATYIQPNLSQMNYDISSAYRGR